MADDEPGRVAVRTDPAVPGGRRLVSHRNLVTYMNTWSALA